MDDFDQTVLEFIKEYPCSATLVRTIEGEYDPDTASASDVVTSTPVQGILMDLTLQSNGLSTKYGTLVEAGDKEFLMRPPHKTHGWAEAMEISSASDKLKVGAITYKIVTLKELNPTGSDQVLVSLYLRR